MLNDDNQLPSDIFVKVVIASSYPSNESKEDCQAALLNTQGLRLPLCFDMPYSRY